MLRFGYNTNGYPFHRLDRALEVLAEQGYLGVALTLDHHHLDPYRATPAEIEGVRRLLDRLGLEAVVETGARYLLDPRRKHEPTLLDPDPANRGRRFALIRRATRIAADLQSKVVSLWSGKAPPGEGRDALFARLCDGLGVLVDEAGRLGVSIALEPEPGMLVERVGDWKVVRNSIRRPNFGLCLDIGHLYCTGEDPAGSVVESVREDLLTVHLEDVRRGVHEHRPPGQGDVDFSEVLSALNSMGYRGLVNLELSRDGHDAPEVSRRALRYLANVDASLQRADRTSNPTGTARSSQTGASG